MAGRIWQVPGSVQSVEVKQKGKRVPEKRENLEQPA